MYLVDSEQYGCPAVVIEEGDTAEEVIQCAEEIRAVVAGDELVVQLRPGVIETYTERALRASMK